MKLSLVEASLSSFASNDCIAYLKQFYNKDTKVFIVVPDRASLSTEQTILEKLDINGFLNFEVVTLNILADELLTKTERKNLSSFGASMVIKNILINNKDKFNCFNKSTNNVNFALLLQGAISQIKSCNIDSKQLKAAAEKMAGAFKLKLLDIALIYEEYEKYLQANFEDGLSKFARLNQELIYSQIVKDSVFMFVGFESFTLQAENIISNLIKNSKQVFIAYSNSPAEAKNNLFWTNEIKEMLQSICNVLSLALSPVIAKQNFLSEDAKYLHDNLLNFDSEAKETPSTFYNITSCENVEEELAFIASTIRKQIAENSDLKFSDFSVAVCNLESYNSRIEEVFSKWELPYFIDTKNSLHNLAITKLVKSFVKVIENDFSAIDVIEFSKNIYLGLSGANASLFENYIIKNGIAGSMFFNSFYDENIELIRKQVLTNVYNYYQQFNTSKNASEMAECIKQFLESENVKQKTEDIALKFSSIEDFKNEKLTTIGYQKLIEVLDEMELALGETQLFAQNFLNLFDVGIEKNAISLIPLNVNTVFVGSVSESFFREVKTLFICGAVEGQFPIYKQDTGLILDEEIRALEKLSVVKPDVATINKRSLATAFSLLFKAKNIYLSYPLSLNGENGKCSVLVLNIKNCLKIKENPFVLDDLELDFFSGSYPTRTVLKDFLSVGYSNALKGIIKKDKHIISALASCLLTAEDKILFDQDFRISNARDIYFNGDKLSVSQLQQWFTCPLSHFFKYGLKLREQENANIEALDIGNIYHLFCYEFVKYLVLNNGISDSKINIVSQSIINKILSAKEFKELAELKANLHLISSAKAEVVNIAKKLKLHFESSNFKSNVDYLERPFSNIKILSEGKDYVVNGKIDRADILDSACDNNSQNERYVRVIDYKTSDKKFSLEKVYYGEQIQLPMYLISMRNEKLKPAGMFYYQISNKLAENKAKSNLSGLIVDQVLLVKQMDTNLNDKEPSTTLPLKITASGGLAKSSSIVSEGEFELLMDYVLKLTKNAISEINFGYIRPSIFKASSTMTDCDYCPYKAMGLCGNKVIREKEKIRLKNK